MAYSSKPQAWVYPGAPACNALTELVDGRKIHTVKPEFYTVNAGGTVTQLTTGTSGCNAYSAANVATYKANSKEVMVTVSGSIGNVRNLVGTPANVTSVITTLRSFVVTENLQGIELDWEQFGSWTATDWTNIKNFWIALGTELHKYGKKLTIDIPAIPDSGFATFFPNFHYNQLNAITEVDYWCVMTYDYQYDYGAGTSVEPLAWANNCVTYATGFVSDQTRLVWGIPSYGYHGTTGGYTITIDTKAQSAGFPGYGTATRNADGEMNWVNGGNSYFYQDTTGLNTKRTSLETAGAKTTSVWHLGGNDWYAAGLETFDAVSSYTTSTSYTPTVISTGNIVTFTYTINNTSVNQIYQLSGAFTSAGVSTIQYSYNNVDWFTYSSAIAIPAVEAGKSGSIYFRGTAGANGSYTANLAITGGNITTSTPSIAYTIGAVAPATGDRVIHSVTGATLVTPGGVIIVRP